MLIKIDNRESSLIYRLNQLSKEGKDIKIKVEKLDLGDIHLCDIDTENAKNNNRKEKHTRFGIFY